MPNNLTPISDTQHLNAGRLNPQSGRFTGEDVNTEQDALLLDIATAIM